MQKAYNELKFTHKKTLDTEVGGLRLKLSESQQYASQLQAQLQLIKSNRLSLACNDLKDLNNNTNMSNAELINYMKRLKHENNELKIQLESERRRFNMEKEKWYLQFQTCMQNKRNSVNISTDNLSINSNVLYTNTATMASSNLQSGHHMATKPSGLLTMNSSQPGHLNSAIVASGGTPSSAKQHAQQKKPFMKNVLFNQQHFL